MHPCTDVGNTYNNVGDTFFVDLYCTYYVVVYVDSSLSSSVSTMPKESQTKKRNALWIFLRQCCSLSVLQEIVDPKRPIPVPPVALQNIPEPPTLYIGQALQAANAQLLQQLQITHIINCSLEFINFWEDTAQSLPSPIHYDKEAPALSRVYKKDVYQKLWTYLETEREAWTATKPIRYLHLPLRDSADEDLKQYEDALMGFMGTVGRDAKVLIHCKAAVSRSVSVTMMYLIVGHQLTFDAALATVTAARPVVSHHSDLITKHHTDPIILMFLRNI
jgi:protein-tyrosine phosphatase